MLKNILHEPVSTIQDREIEELRYMYFHCPSFRALSISVQCFFTRMTCWLYELLTHQKRRIGSCDCSVGFDEGCLQLAHLFNGGRSDSVIFDHCVSHTCKQQRKDQNLIKIKMKKFLRRQFKAFLNIPLIDNISPARQAHLPGTLYGRTSDSSPFSDAQWALEWDLKAYSSC